MRHTSLVSGRRSAAERVRAPVALVGDSEPARRARASLDSAVSRRTPVLISAEAGCRPAGIARALHRATRAGGPFVSLDCTAVEAPELLARVFGTPSDAAGSGELETLTRSSALVSAGAGTLFVDNFDELPASAQRRLARLLRDGEARVQGVRAPVEISVRIVAATSRDLDAEVLAGRFRQDLLRRFQGCHISVPPLRQRPSDLGAMIERLVEDATGGPRAFTQPAITVLAALPWPANVDELAAVLARILASSGPVVRQEDVLEHLPIDGAFSRIDLTASLREARRRFEREYIAAVLERHQWRMSDAARALGIERANLYRKTRQLGITRGQRAEAS